MQTTAYSAPDPPRSAGRKEGRFKLNMKAYGYKRGDANERGEGDLNEQPLDLREVSLTADSQTLRRIWDMGDVVEFVG